MEEFFTVLAGVNSANGRHPTPSSNQELVRVAVGVVAFRRVEDHVDKIQSELADVVGHFIDRQLAELAAVVGRRVVAVGKVGIVLEGRLPARVRNCKGNCNWKALRIDQFPQMLKSSKNCRKNSSKILQK